MKFARFGRTRHLRIGGADDLAGVLDLDEAHWVATSAPVNTLRSDEAFLKLVDADGCGRIRASELEDAIVWMFDQLRDTSGVTRCSKVVKLDALNVERDEGRRIHDSAQKMLASLNRAKATEINLDEIRLIKARLEGTSVSEAGVALPEAAEEGKVRQFMTDAIATIGGAPHPSGRQGIDGEQLNQFISQARATLDWEAAVRPTDDDGTTRLLPLGDDTAAAFGLLMQLRDKIDQYFAQCEAVAFDEKLAAHLPPHDADIRQADLSDPHEVEVLVRRAPLAKPRPDRTLGLNDSINRFYAAPLEGLRARVLAPMLGSAVEQLTDSQWKQVKDDFAPYGTWMSAKPSEAVGKLGLEKLESYCDPALADAVRALISRSHETAFQLDNIRLAEKLALYQAHLIELANNYVSFPDLYDPDSLAMFEMGSLIMDGRRFHLAVKVENRSEHARVAQGSGMFVLYVQVAGRDGAPTTELSVPVTSGGRGNLAVGKRGVFVDVDGRQSDARVVQIIENPISVVEALVAPFKRIGSLVSGKIEQITGTAEKQLDLSTQQAMTQMETGVAGGSAAAPPDAPKSAQTRGMLAGGVLAGGGLALAAVGSALTYMGKVVSEHGGIVLLVVGGAILAVLLPGALLACIKLRRRDLSAILEGSGWAINARMCLTRAQTRQFTQRPAYPAGARGVRDVRSWVITLVVVICCAVIGYGAYQAWAFFRSPASVQSTVQEHPSKSDRTPENISPDRKVESE